jgi:hypothetical protein
MLPFGVQIDREKYLLLCFALAAGCGSSQPAQVVKGSASVPSPIATGAGIGAAPASQDVGAPAAVATPAQRPATSEDPEMDAIGQDLEKIEAARRDCNPPPDAERLAQLEVQGVEERPHKQSPLEASCNRIEVPQPGKLPGPACEDPFFDCYAAIKMLRPESARTFVACLAPKSNTRAMCGHGPGNCVAQAVNATTPAPQVQAVCARIAKRCRAGGSPQMSEALCRKYLTAVDCDEVPTAGHCMANACSLRRCFDPLDEPEQKGARRKGSPKRVTDVGD